MRSTNPCSTIKIKAFRCYVDESRTFERMYYCLHALKRGFLDGCRPIIGLDGCFLKGPFGGQLLSALGRDGNDNMLPIAFAVVEVECFAAWVWFLKLLRSDLGTRRVDNTPWTSILAR